jgi:hypothetical protein
VNAKLKREIEKAIEVIESDPAPPAAVQPEPEPPDDETVVLLEPNAPPESVCRGCGQRFLRCTFVTPFYCTGCRPPQAPS